MAQKIKILHLEDLPTDAELVARELRDGGIQFETLVVDNEKDFIYALTEYSPEIILSDHSLPSFSSLDALRILKAHQINIPFILITAMTSEEIAVNVMKEGAWDYILKDRMQRLPTAVTQAIEKNKILQIQKRAENDLRESEEKYRTLIEQASDGIAVFNKALRFVDCNSSLCEMIGYAKDELLTMKANDFVSADDLKKEPIRLEELILGRTILSERTLIRKDTTKLSVEISSKMLKDDRIQLFIRDITKRKQIEMDLINSELRYRTLFENNVAGNFQTSVNGDILVCNKAFAKMFGYTNDELLQLNATDLYFSKDDRDKVISDLFKNKILLNYETVLRHRDNSPIYAIENISARFDPTSGAEIIDGVIVDITVRKKAELELAESENRLRTILDTEPECIKLLGPMGDLLYMNPAGLAMLEASSLKIIEGKSILDIVEPEYRNAFSDLTKSVFNGDSGMLEFEITGLKGTHRWLETHAVPLKNINGKITSLLSVTRDISSRKQSEEKLAANEKRFRALVENISDGIVVTDEYSNLIYQSPSVTHILGYSESERLGLPLQNFVHPDNLEEYKLLYQSLRGKPNQPHPFEFRCLHKNGKYVWMEGVITNLLNEPSVKGIVSNYRDITERKTLLNILREYHDRYEIVSKATNDAIWDWDIEKDLEIWNHGTESIFGYLEREVNSSRIWWEDKLHPMDYNRIHNELEESFARKAMNWTSQYQYLCADGTYKYVLDRAFIIYKDGKPVRMIGAMQDITKQKEFEKKITNIARELSSLIDNANIPIFGVDRNGYINEWNRITATLSEYSRNEILGKKWVDMMDLQMRDKVLKILSKTLAGESSNNYELPLVNKSGKQLTLLLSISTRRDLNNNVIGALCVGQDLTELIQYRNGLENLVEERTRELNEALKKEKELVEMKSNFVSIASHEFRTPLSTISLATGFIRKYLNQLTPDGIGKKLGNIEKQVDQMVILLDDILTVGKAEGGKIKATFSKVEIELLQKIAVEVIQSRKSKHKLHFYNECNLTTIITDEKLIRNIITNLISNAVKFSPDAQEVILKINCDSKNISITVKDWGIGIPPKDIKNLFTSFTRASNVRDIEGTGLGLSIVKKVVQILNGKITVNSELGAGTEFNVTLPLHHV